MIIKWYGQSCFRIDSQGGHLSVVIDPFNKSIGLNPPRGNADIVLISHDHLDHNNLKALSGDPFVINGPGEYEVKGARIIGISSYHDNSQGKERGMNTFYLIKIDGIKICHLGDFGQERLTDRQLESIASNVDILMIPVGGKVTLDSKQAAKVVEQLEPKTIIPMHYKIPGLKLGVELDEAADFLKRIGANGKEPVDKLMVKPKDLSEKVMEVVVMKP